MIKQQTFSSPDVSNFINLIPDHHTGITRCNAYNRFSLDHATQWFQTWKRRHLLGVGKVGELVDSLSSPKTLRLITLIERVGDNSLSSIKHPLLKAEGGTTAQYSFVWATNQHQKEHMPDMSML